MKAAFQQNYMKSGLISDPLTTSKHGCMGQPGHEEVLYCTVVKGELHSEGLIFNDSVMLKPGTLTLSKVTGI